MSSGPVAFGFIQGKSALLGNTGKAAGKGADEGTPFDRLVGQDANDVGHRSGNSNRIADRISVVRTAEHHARALDDAAGSHDKDKGRAVKTGADPVDAGKSAGDAASENSSDSPEPATPVSNDHRKAEKFEQMFVRHPIEGNDVVLGRISASGLEHGMPFRVWENAMTVDPDAAPSIVESDETKIADPEKVQQELQERDAELKTSDRRTNANVDTNIANASNQAIPIGVDIGRLRTNRQADPSLQPLRRTIAAVDRTPSKAGEVGGDSQPDMQPDIKPDMQSRVNDAKPVAGPPNSPETTVLEPDAVVHRGDRRVNSGAEIRGEPIAKMANLGDKPAPAPVKQSALAGPVVDRPVGVEPSAPAPKTLGHSPAALSLLTAIENNTNWSTQMKSAPVVQGAVQNTGGNIVQSMRIQLHPQELGMVDATLRISGGKISLVLNVDQDTTRQALLRDSQAIHNALRMSGFQVDEVAIAATPQDNETSGTGERTFQNGGATSEKPKEQKNREQDSFEDGDKTTDKEPVDDRFAPAGGSVYI